MAYVTVYSPKGEKFEVASRDRADKLILEDGWTQTPPEKKQAKKKASPRRKNKKEESAFDGFAGFDAPEVVEDEEPQSENS